MMKLRRIYDEVMTILRS